MCESSSMSPSFSSERSCRRKLVYRDVVLVRRLLRYDDMLLQKQCERNVACVTGGQITFIKECRCSCICGVVLQGKWCGMVVVSDSSAPNTPTNLCKRNEMRFLELC